MTGISKSKRKLSLPRKIYYGTRENLSLVRKNVRDVITLGWHFPKRFWALAQNRAETTLIIKKFGQIRFRVRGSDTELVRQIFSQRVYDLTTIPHFGDIADYYQALLKLGRTPVIIDAGANIGISAMWFARQFPLARVVAVEPDPTNASICQTNLAAFANSSVIVGAIGAEPGMVSLDNTESEAAAIRTVRTETPNGIRVHTIEQLLQSIPAGSLFIVKVDIEGFESDLFRTATDWLGTTKVVFVEPHDWLLPGRNTSLAFQKAISRHDFEILIKGENLIYVNTQLH